MEKNLQDLNETIKIKNSNEINLKNRIKSLSSTENELREKVLASETEFGERLRLAALRERELTDKVNNLNQFIDDLKIKADKREQELQEKINIYQDEIHIVRRNNNSNRNSPEVQNSCNSNSNYSNNSLIQRCSSTSLNDVTALQDEVESLRCVLELKQSEISDLRKQNLEHQRAAEELPAALFKVSSMESRVEDLQVQLHLKYESEK